MSSRGPANTAEATLDLQDRIGRLARLLFAVATTTAIAVHVVSRVEPKSFPEDHTPAGLIAHTALVVVLFLAWRRCRGSAMRQPTLEALDAALTIVVCTSWGLMGWGAIGPSATLGMILGLTHTLIARSVVVPSAFRRTLWISAVAAVPTILVIAMRGMSLLPEASPQRVRIFFLFSTLWCCVAVAVAAVNSKTLYGLRQQILEAGRLGQYKLEEKIGEGGMGVVHRATHAMLRRPAAIKLLLKDRAGEKDLARFEREVQLTSRLSHPNTISIFDYGRTAEGVFYYVMEYLDGMDLDRLVREDGPLDPARAIHILAQASGALAEAHALGLIHRDIKPANVVLTERADEPDVVKVVDFGLVKTLESNQGESGFAGGVIGTPMYLAPEAITSPETVDGRSDLYALGAVAYFLLTGTQVFEAATVVEVCSKHLTEKPVAPSERLGKPLPADLEALILSCLAKDREARPASAAALRAALFACVDAARYDVPAARAWWRDRGAKLRASARPVSRSLEHATTMAIDLRGRDGEAPSAIVR